MNWRRSPWDLSGAIVDTETDEWIGEVEVVMTDAEYEAIQTLPLRDIASRRVILGAVHTPDGILVGGPPADIDLLLVAIDVSRREERRADRKRILQQVARKFDDALLQSA